jgi:hypothetical protein
MLPTSLALAIFAFGAAVTFILGLWTWRRLWRHPITDRYSTLVYRHGVRGFGVFMFVAMTFVVPLLEADSPLGQGVASRRFCGDFVLRAVIGLPLWLWAGYWCGRAMAWVTGIRPTSSTPGRDRTHS